MNISLRLNDPDEYTDNKFGSLIETLTDRYDVALFYQRFCFIVLADKPNNNFQYILSTIVREDESESWKVEQIRNGTIECYKNIGFEFMESIRNTNVYPHLSTIDFPFDEVVLRYFDDFTNHFYTED